MQPNNLINNGEGINKTVDPCEGHLERREAGQAEEKKGQMEQSFMEKKIRCCWYDG